MSAAHRRVFARVPTGRPIAAAIVAGIPLQLAVQRGDVRIGPGEQMPGLDSCRLVTSTRGHDRDRNRLELRAGKRSTSARILRLMMAGMARIPLDGTWTSRELIGSPQSRAAEMQFTGQECRNCCSQIILPGRKSR